MPAWVTATISIQSFSVNLRHRRVVAVEHRLERHRLLPLGVLGRHLRQPVEGEEALAVERLLDPGGAVLVEGGDPVARAPRSRRRPRWSSAATRSRIACFAAPSFQDGSGSSGRGPRRRTRAPSGAASATASSVRRVREGRKSAIVVSLRSEWASARRRTRASRYVMISRSSSSAIASPSAQRPEGETSVTASITRSRLKLPGFCRGGNSRKLCSQLPTKAAAGAIRNIRSRYQRW